MTVDSNILSSKIALQMRRTKPEWELINFANGTLNCPLCPETITPQIRSNRSKFGWLLGNLKRHLVDIHPMINGK